MATRRAKRAGERARRENRKEPPKDALRLEDLVGYNLRRAHGVQRQRFAHVFGPYAIRPVLLSVLGLIHDNPGLKQAELGRKLDIKRANVVTLLDELQARELVTRRIADTDRRSHVLELTPAGKTLTATILELHRRLEEDLVQALGGVRERDQLLELLKRFRRLETDPDIGDPD